MVGGAGVSPMMPPPSITQQPFIVPPPLLGPMWVQPPNQQQQQPMPSHIDFDYRLAATADTVDSTLHLQPQQQSSSSSSQSAINESSTVTDVDLRSASAGQSWRTTAMPNVMIDQDLLRLQQHAATTMMPSSSSSQTSPVDNYSNRDPRQRLPPSRTTGGDGSFFGTNATTAPAAPVASADNSEPYNANQVPLGSGIGSETMTNVGRDPRRRNRDSTAAAAASTSTTRKP